jgi:hypothetical protein
MRLEIYHLKRCELCGRVVRTNEQYDTVRCHPNQGCNNRNLPFTPQQEELQKIGLYAGVVAVGTLLIGGSLFVLYFIEFARLFIRSMPK